MARTVLITGAEGYVGRKLVAALARERRGSLIAADVRAPASPLPGVEHLTLDVRSPDLARVITARGVDTVVHLAAVVTGSGLCRDLQYDVDVRGTENLLRACQAGGVGRIVVLSSAAAYGYHPDNPPLLTEDLPLRGNEDFPYAHHKRLVEEMLGVFRAEHPEMQQVVFRPATILGAATASPVTALFERPVILGVAGADSPFSFIWDEDVVACLARAVDGGPSGIYNLAGDGVLTLAEIAARLGKPYLPVPAETLEGALRILSRHGVTEHGPEQVAFLRWRPVPSNERLKAAFGYRPKKTSREVFDLWARGRQGRVVVVTGAASGIGRAIAARFARDGDRVAMLDVDAAGLERAAGELESEGREVLPLPCDVRDAAACAEAIARVAGEWGGIDVLVNNAGIAHRSLFSDTDPAVVRRVLEVNFLGAVHCTKAALPSLLARRGTIVAISSVAGFAPLVGRTGYAASKHALHGFFDSLRAELAGTGVNVLLVCPGFTDTAIDASALGGDGGPARPSKAVVGRKAAPAEVAGAVADAVARRQRLRVVSPVGLASYYLLRLLPMVYEALMRRSLRADFAVILCAVALAACGGGSAPPAPATPEPPALRCKPFAAPGPGPRFRDATSDWGLSDVRGGRVAVGDLDGDGFPDLLVHVIGTHNRADFSRTPDRWPYRVLLNRAGRFLDATIASGYGATRDGAPNAGRSAQLAVLGDVDDDGDLDVLSATSVDPTRPDTDPGDRTEILLNRGDATFVLGLRPVVATGDPTTSAAFLDDDRDGRLDLFLGNGYAAYGRSYLGAQDRLLRGAGDGTFWEVTAEVGLGTPGTRPERADAPRPTYGVTACDLDGDGRTDLLTSSYGRQPNLLWMRGVNGFREVGQAAGFAFDDARDYTDNEFYRCYCQTSGLCSAPAPRIACDAQLWTPGVDDQPWRLGGNTFTTACADLDNDGDPDLVNAEIVHWHIGSSSDRSEILVNEGSAGGVPRLVRPGRAATGLAVPHVGVSWNEGGIAAAIADLDNDGRPDVLLGASDYDDNYLWVFHQQPDGTFREVGEAAGLHHPCAPHFALADLDRDGDLDLVVASSTARSFCASRWPRGPEIRVYENLSGQDANWTQIHLEGAGAAAGGANRSAIGAVVRVSAGGVTRTREVQGGYGHFGMQHDLDVTIGLGDACEIDVLEVRWPDAAGSVERYEGVRANYRIAIRQGRGLEYLP